MRVFRSRKLCLVAIAIFLLFQAVSGYPQDPTLAVGSVLTDKKQRKPIQVKSDAKPYLIHVPLQKDLTTYEVPEDTMENTKDDVKYKVSGRAGGSIENKVKDIIAKQAGMKPTQIENNANLRDLGLDSLDDVEISIALRKEFGCAIEDDECDQIKTVQDAVNTVKRIC